MALAKAGDRVRVHYTGRTDEGEVFDSSLGKEPLAFELGAGRVIAGFDAAVTGMRPGEKKTVRIECADAYGPHQEARVVKVPRASFPEGVKPVVGMQVPVKLKNGSQTLATVMKVTPFRLTLDTNHPLSGKDLTFELELVGID